MNTVEKWGLLEVSLKGPSAGNPFTEQSVSATFRSKNEIRAITSMKRSAASRKRSLPAISP